MFGNSGRQMSVSDILCWRDNLLGVLAVFCRGRDRHPARNLRGDAPDRGAPGVDADGAAPWACLSANRLPPHGVLFPSSSRPKSIQRTSRPRASPRILLMLQTTKKERINTRIFKAVHGKNLIYNTCWEDPALDRVALDLRPDDRVVGHHQRRLQRPRLPPGRHRRGQRRRCQPDPERPAGTEASPPSAARLRLVLRAVRQRPLAARPADVPRRAPPAPVAVRPRLLGQAHRLLPRQGLAASRSTTAAPPGLLAKLALTNAHVPAPPARADRASCSPRTTIDEQRDDLQRARSATASGRRGCAGSCRAA